MRQIKSNHLFAQQLRNKRLLTVYETTEPDSKALNETSPRRRSSILQRRVPNPSQRGTGGGAPKAPRRVRSGEGAAPLQNIFVFLASKWCFYGLFIRAP